MYDTDESERIAMNRRERDRLKVLHGVRCAVPRCVSSVGWKSPSGNWSFQPVASGAAWEVTNTSEPSLNQDR